MNAHATIFPPISKDGAHWAVEKGLRVFPNAPGQKRPAISDNLALAECSHDAVERWAKELPGCNFSAVPGPQYFVLDIDVKDDGPASLFGLEDQYGILPPTLTIRTPSGGMHYWFKGRAATTARKLGAGLDTRGSDANGEPSGYVLLPGSVLADGSRYEIQSDLPIADAPPWLTDLLKPAQHEKLDALADIELDLQINVARFAGYLAREPEWLEGHASDDQCFSVAGAGKDYGLSPEKITDMMCERAPHFDREWITEKVANAYAYGQNEPGAKALLSDAETFAGVEIPTAAPEPQAPGNVIVYPPPKSAAELVRGHFPRPSYTWQDFILERFVNLNYGDGGVGKTLLTEHIAVAVAAGVPLFGRATRQMPVLLVLAEDDDGETKARLAAIAAMLGVDLVAITLTTWCLPGHDLTLARITDDGTVKDGPFMGPLRETLANIGPCLLILDTVSDFAALNESLRLPVNAFCKRVLGGLCRDYGTTVLVNAHPSKAAMADGSHYAGSTAWNNSVRNRLTFERPEPKSPRRILRVAKANYGAEAELELFQLGMTFVTEDAIDLRTKEAQEHEAVLTVALEMIDGGISVVRANGSGQKPADVAKVVRERHGFAINPKRVLEHLNYAERAGTLEYINGGNQKRGQRAGFRRKGSA